MSEAAARATALGAGIDVGGTKILASALEPGGVIRRQARITSPRSADDLPAALVAVLGELVGGLGGERSAFASVGLALPGLVDRGGRLHAAPNLGAAEIDVDLRARIGGPLLAELARLGIALTPDALAYDNDATCAAYAEAAVGAAAGEEDVLVVSFGTGIGAGIVVGGEVLRGAHGYAGEIGHVVIDPEGPECPCGRRGCWERYASGPGLTYLAMRSGALVSSGEEVVAAARAGEAWAKSAVLEFAQYVALGLANATEFLDPARIVLGGGLMQAADVLFEPIRAAYGAMNRAAQRRSPDDLVLATLGEDAASVGAGLLGLVAIGA